MNTCIIAPSRMAATTVKPVDPQPQAPRVPVRDGAGVGAVGGTQPGAARQALGGIGGIGWVGTYADGATAAGSPDAEAAPCGAGGATTVAAGARMIPHRSGTPEATGAAPAKSARDACPGAGIDGADVAAALGVSC
jgi:hypothetical protein